MGEIADPARKSIGARRNPDSAEAILEAAEAVLIEAGYAGFSIEAVARRARAGKPTIYRWWPSKAALLLEVYQRQKRVDIPDTGSLEQDLVGFLINLFTHWRETSSGSVFKSLIAEAQSDETAAAALAGYRRRLSSSPPRRAACGPTSPRYSGWRHDRGGTSRRQESRCRAPSSSASFRPGSADPRWRRL